MALNAAAINALKNTPPIANFGYHDRTFGLT